VLSMGIVINIFEESAYFVKIFIELTEENKSIFCADFTDSIK